MKQLLPADPRYKQQAERLSIARGGWQAEISAHVDPIPQEGRVGEDLISVGGNYILVLDGVGVKNGAKFYERGSTPWFTRRFAERFDELLTEAPDRELIPAFQIARRRVAGELSKAATHGREEASGTVWTQFPSSAAAIVRIRDNGILDTYNLCDTGTLLDTTGKLELLMQDHDPHLLYPEANFGGKAEREEALRNWSISPQAAEQKWRQDRQKWLDKTHYNHWLRNASTEEMVAHYAAEAGAEPEIPTPGFFVINSVPGGITIDGRNLAREADNAIMRGMTASFPLSTVSTAVIGSDGLFRALTLAGMSKKDILTTAQLPGGLSQLHQRVRTGENDDPLCLQHPREKRHDDLSVAKAKFSRR